MCKKLFVKGNRGFTLIELLVVIAIIGILSSVVLASLSTARNKGTDAKRISEMKQLQTVMELYHLDNGMYPASPVNTRVVNMDTGNSDITPYINPIPQDPTYTGNQGYRYQAGPSRRSYTMMLWRYKDNNQWCHIGVEPGTGWVENWPPC